MINVGIVGYGYWGPNLVRNFSEAPGSRVRAICDLRKDKLDKAARRHPGVALTTEYKDLIGDPSIDAVIIATPVSAHFPLAMEALKAGKHLWVEKPIAAPPTRPGP